MNSFVTFIINGQTMGIDMLNVEKIIKLSKISPIPDSPDYLEGIINMQNCLIPVINLKKTFNFSSKDVSPDSNIIIVYYQNKRSGIIVDSVNDIIQIDEETILKTQSNKYVFGVVNVDNAIVNLLNSNSLTSD